jgi:23S rRNA (guanosine2251-2'-O)-methyltransferase
MNPHILLILDNLRSVQNTASIFRTADAAGVSKIILVGTTPTPIDRFEKIRKDFGKVSLGAELTVPWKYMKTISPVLTKLKKEKFKIFALEQDKTSRNYSKVKYPGKIVLVVGNEPYGISKSTLKKVDTIIEIPMFGKKESLNVSVATGIALFRMIRP